MELVVNCDGGSSSNLDRAGGNATYTSKMAVVEFVVALWTWMEECLLFEHGWKSVYSRGFTRHPFLAS